MITQELFDTLPQLDRIEFRQKQDNIYKKFTTNITSTIIAFHLFCFIVGSLFIGLCFGGETMLLFMNQVYDNLGLIIFTVILAIVGDCLIFHKKNKMLKKLYENYFEFKVNIKESKTNGKRKK